MNPSSKNSPQYENEKERLQRLPPQQRREIGQAAARQYPGLTNLKHRVDRNPRVKRAVKAALARLGPARPRPRAR